MRDHERAQRVRAARPTVLGNGLRQRTDEEMTADLASELAAAKTKAASTQLAVTQALRSKCVSFGALVANPDGTVNTAGVGFRVHFGMQTSPSIAAVTPAAQTRANSGEALFAQVGCASCHVPKMTIKTPMPVEPADTIGGAGITLRLATDTKDPRPALDWSSVATSTRSRRLARARAAPARTASASRRSRTPPRSSSSTSRSSWSEIGLWPLLACNRSHARNAPCSQHLRGGRRCVVMLLC